MRKQVSQLLLGFFCCVLPVSVAQAEEPHVAPMMEYANNNVRAWIGEQLVIDAIKAQNTKHQALGETDIDALDKQWRAEVSASSHPMVDDVLNSALSKHLASIKQDEEGLVTEIFVMDNKGLNVGQSDPTSDFWQGDEAKWQKTYLVGPDAIFVDDVEEDESTQSFQSQLSMSIADPETGEVIGAITVGVDIEKLL